VRRSARSAADINEKNTRFELSPWLLSIVVGDLPKSILLAELGADLTQTGRCGLSPLHLAAQHGRDDVVRWLLDYGANVHAVTTFGETPLHCAVEWDHYGSASALIQASADPSAQNRTQSQPIQEALSLQVLQLLVEVGGADLNAISGTGDWPLKSAAEVNDTTRIDWLLNHGAEVDRTSTGETALHSAVRSDSRESVKLLLDAGADPNAQDVDGQPPLFEAKTRETIWTLLEAGAQTTIKDQVGWGTEYWMKDPILKAALKGK
jgi:ankyrin repeat protein